MSELSEAVTIKAQARGALNALAALLGRKDLAKDLRDQVEGLSTALKKKWADLEAGDGEVDEAERSYRDKMRLLEAAIRETEASRYDWGPWICDLYEGWLVYEWEGHFYRRTYIIDADNMVTLGERTEVIAQTVYTPVGANGAVQPAAYVGLGMAVEASEAAIDGDVIPLVEKAVRTDGSIDVRLIQPGWGSSGYYPADVLERDGPAVFKKGTHMYWDHPTVTEAAERPERSLRDLAAELTTDAVWQPDHPQGAGLYAQAQVFEAYRDAVNELAPHIGTSIRASGRAKQGTVEGRKGPIIEQILAAGSVDFVTVPGAGGRVLQLFEAARGLTGQRSAVPDETQSVTEAKTVDENEAKVLREANEALSGQVTEMRTHLQEAQAELARMREGQLLRDARDVVASTLAEIQMPAMTRQRLTEALSVEPMLKDGTLDREAYVARIKEAAESELRYLGEVAGLGQIRGMGSVGSGETTPEKASEQLVEAFIAMGLPESEAKIAAAGR
jgi:hypothetical protein